MPPFEKFVRWFDSLMSALCSAFAISFGVCTLLVCVDIVGRQFGIVSMPWLVEIIEYIMYGGTFLAAPWVLRQGEHVRVDLVLSSVPKAVAIRLEQLIDALGFIVSTIMCVYGTALAVDA
jgi:TRAP-type C4-dicarboxylate transport system permease small subunit